MPRHPLALALFAAIVLAGAAKAQPIDPTAGEGRGGAGPAGIGLRGAITADDRGSIGHDRATPARRPASAAVALRSGLVGTSAAFSGNATGNAVPFAPWHGSEPRMRGDVFGGGSYMTVGAALAALSSRSHDVATRPARAYTLPVAATLMRPGRGRPDGSMTIGEGEQVTGLAMARRLDVAIPAVVPIGAGRSSGQSGIREGVIRAFR